MKPSSAATSVARARTAIRRVSCSRPLALALAHGLISKATEVLDYGCGHGADVRYLVSRKLKARGWDPHHKPDPRSLRAADVVTMNYVLNVIEDPAERAEALTKAFDFARRVLVVAVRVDQGVQGEAYGDGVLTTIGSFQKIYAQAEFKEYLESTLGRRIQVASLGVGYIFKDQEAEQQYLADRAFTRRLEYRADLVAEFTTNAVAKRYVTLANQLGRTPLPEEFPQLPRLFELFGSPARLERLLLHAIDRAAFDGSREMRRQDIVTYLAMLRLQGMTPPPVTFLPQAVREDLKAIWGNYASAKGETERFLFSIGKPDVIRAACAQSAVGKLLPEDFYVHRSFEDDLPAILRLVVFAARQIVGDVEYDLVKLKLDGRAVSFLRYVNFDAEAHPALLSSVRVYLPRTTYAIRDYAQFVNPPILHRKDRLVGPAYPRYLQFRSLTEAEERNGLLSQKAIGFRQQWDTLLASRGLRIANHSLVRTDKSGAWDEGSVVAEAQR